MKSKKNEELKSRREFFKKAAKSALPILGAVVLSSTPLISKAAESTYCNYGCSYGCEGCSDSCYGSCKGSCNSSCVTGNCSYTCSGGCDTSCSGACKISCRGWNY